MRWLLVGLLVLLSGALVDSQEPGLAASSPLELGGSTEKAKLVLNPEGHVGPIQEVFFTPDGTRLLTVGTDQTVQLWDVASGERLKVLRLPFPQTAAALAPDGKTLAIARDFGKKGKGRPRLRLVNLDDGRVHQLQGGRDHPGQFGALTFSPDGDQLAGSAWGVNLLWEGLKGAWEKTPAQFANIKPRSFTPDDPRNLFDIFCLAFSPDGKRIALGRTTSRDEGIKTAYVAGIPDRGVEPRKPLPLNTLNSGSADIRAIAWTPDGKEVVTVDQNPGPTSAVRFFSAANGKLQRQFKLGTRDGSGLHFVNDQRLLLTWFWPGSPTEKPGHGQSILRLNDPIQERRGPSLIGGDQPHAGRGALSRDGKLAALAGAGRDRNEILIWDVASGKVLHHLGHLLKTPRAVGWSKDGRYLGLGAFQNKKQPFFGYGLDLKEMQLSQKVDRTDYLYKYRTNGDWTVKQDGFARLRQGDKLVGAERSSASTLSPAKEPRWWAFGGPDLHLHDIPTNKKIVPVLNPVRQRVYDLAPSPDGRFLVSVNETQVAYIYHIADDPARTNPQPLLYLYLLQGDWVLWTREGYYAASPGGEKLMGWTVDNGPDKLPTFHPAQRFRKQLYRPDLLKKVFELGSVAAALKAANAALPAKERPQTDAPADLEKLLPPKCTLQILKENGREVTVQVNAVAQVKNQPVVAVRLLLDGRPLPEEEGYREFAPPQPEVRRDFTLTLPPGQHTLSVLARSQDASALSEAVTVGQVVSGRQSVLHLVAIGIDNYGNGIPQLKCAVNDARDLTTTFPLVKQGNLFHDVKTHLLDNQKATAQGIRAQLAKLRPNLKREDVLVFFFAGHGVREGKEFYLLTAEADPGQLATSALSGKELSQQLRDLPCQVLLLLDACHSGAVARNLRPATDDAVRTLADDEVGVIVLAATMGHEKALEEPSGNGYFTKALKQALVGQGKIFFSEGDGRMYVHHLHSVVLDRVSGWSAQRQHPYLSLPSTALPLALRQFARK